MIINFDNIGSGSGSGGTGSVVSWRQDLSAGTQIAEISINGNSQPVYAPEEGDVVYSFSTVRGYTDQQRKDLWATISSQVLSGHKRVWFYYDVLGAEAFYPAVYIASGTGTHLFGNYDKYYRYFIEFSKNALHADIKRTQFLHIPTASTTTLGGVKVGSGLTIDSSGVLSVSGGTGGDSKYVVVEALSAVTNPVEGMIAYVPDKTVQYSNVQVITLSNTEGEGFDDYVGWINFNGTSVREIFQGGGGLKFYFEYGNSGKWMRLKGDYEGQEYTQLYRTHNDSQPSIEISAPLDLQGVDFTIAVNDSHPGITTASTSNNFSLKENGGIYRYEASEWVRVSVPKVYNLSEMDTTARVALYDELLPYFAGNGSFATRFPAEEYRFLVNASDMGENYGAIPVSLSTYGSDDGNALFFIGATAGKWAEPVYGFRASLSPDGNLETGKYEARSYEGLPIQAVNYFDDGDNRLIFNTSTSAFTYGHNIDEAQPIVNGNTIGGSALWFCIKPWDGNWAIGVPRLMLLVTDGNGSATYYTNPSIKTKFIPTVTIDGIDYNIEYTGNYGEVSVRFKVSDNGNAANFEFIENS